MDVLNSILRPVATKTPETFKKGTVSLTPRGFGFIDCGEDEPYFLPPPEARSVLSGDVVSFKVRDGGRPGSVQASVVRILERPDSVWQGVLVPADGGMVLKPDADQACFATLEVPDLSMCAPGLVVSVRVPGFSGTTRSPQWRIKARVERILGERSRAGFIQDYALARYDFPVQFSDAALAEARAFSGEPKADGNRADLQHIPFVTIDGESTRDFDDAIYAEKTETGWSVQVAIADVSYFVRPGSALEKEAYERATSVYLPGVVVPMLPEVLSTGACSLVEATPRYALVVALEVDAQGAIVSSRTTRAVICSARQLTYAQAQAWHEGELALPENITPSLSALWELYELLSRNRRESGRLEMETPEPKWVGDGTGAGTIAWTDRTEAHKVVEELMLLANRAVAQQLTGGKGLFRHQPAPELERWSLVRDFATKQGHALPEEPSLPALSEMLQVLDGETAFKAELHARNSMSPARYSHEHAAHFSLNMPAYTHFSSPIRRFADLLVHRLLLSEDRISEERLAQLSAHCSERSRSARMCERMVWDHLKKKAHWEAEAHQLMKGYVVHQSRNGARVVTPTWQTAVFLPGRSLQAAGFEFDPQALEWVHENLVLELGTTVSFKLSELVTEDSKVDLTGAIVMPEAE